MAKKVNTLVLDASLNYIIDHCTHVIACEGEPLNYEAAISGDCHLADTTMNRGDFLIGPGDTNGRKLTIKEKRMKVSKTGKADHVALVDSATSTLLYVTTSTPKVIQAKDNLTMGAWDIEVADPS